MGDLKSYNFYSSFTEYFKSYHPVRQVQKFDVTKDNTRLSQNLKNLTPIIHFVIKKQFYGLWLGNDRICGMTTREFFKNKKFIDKNVVDGEMKTFNIPGFKKSEDGDIIEVYISTIKPQYNSESLQDMSDDQLIAMIRHLKFEINGFYGMKPTSPSSVHKLMVKRNEYKTELYRRKQKPTNLKKSRIWTF